MGVMYVVAVVQNFIREKRTFFREIVFTNFFREIDFGDPYIYENSNQYYFQ